MVQGKSRGKGSGTKPKGPNLKPPKNKITSPLTPITGNGEASKPLTVLDPQSNLASPFQTPPTSPTTSHTSDPETPEHPVPPLSPTVQTAGISAEGMSKDIVAIAETFAAMKNMLATMTGAFDRLGTQTEKMASLSLDIKAAEQLNLIRDQLNAQIERQKAELEEYRGNLEAEIKKSVQEQMTAQAFGVVQSTIARTIEEKVGEQLAVQIPEDLRQQVISHRRQILEIKTDLQISEARRYHGTLQSAALLTAPLRPLLRPLPTPEQSPVAITISSSTDTNSVAPSPTSAFPKVPAPTPIKRTTSRGLAHELAVPSTPSLLFPRDLKSLFNLKPGEAKKLLEEYGLASSAPTPSTDKPKSSLPSVKEEATNGAATPKKSADEEEEEEAALHVEGMNKFMAHIGVPFLMIPPPKAKDCQTTPMSATTRRRMLAPLIINTGPSLY